MKNTLEIAAGNTERAWQIIRETDVINIWKSAGAEINLVGSLKTGLLMKRLDIDFHIYSTPLEPSQSFAAMAKLAENPAANLINTGEHCIEWHAWYLDQYHELWQIDMIHILKGSFYDRYFERVAEQIVAALTPETKLAILTLKNETPDPESIKGIEYCKAVLQDGVRSYAELAEWKKKHSGEGIIEWTSGQTR